MSELLIQLDGGQTGYLPGETVRGSVAWSVERAPREVAVRLVWFTRGQGQVDVRMVDKVDFDRPGVDELRRFEFVLPEGPYSFEGKLVSLVWAVEAVVEPGSLAERVELVVSPTGMPVALHEPVR